MFRQLFMITSLLTLTGSAQLNDPNQPKTSSTSSLPVGATLTKFSHPRFDTNKNPVSLLTAEEMVVTATDIFTGNGLTLRLFGEDRKVRSMATMETAKFLVKQEQLIAEGDLFIRATDNQFSAQGNGGIMHLASRQGLLLGPAQTMFLLPQKKRVSMNLSIPLFLTSIQLLAAAPPLVITAQELADFERAVAPKMIPPAKTEESLAQSQKLVNSLNQRLTQFLTTTGQLHLTGQVTAPKLPKETKRAELFKASDDRMIIESDRAIYFDGENNEFAYLGKVKLTARGMIMTCTDGVKALMNPPPPKKEAKETEQKKSEKDAEKEKFGDFKGIGDVKQVTASGSILLLGRNEKGEPVELRAERAVYNKEQNEVILRGSKMFFRNGQIAAKTSDAKATAKVTLLGKGKLSAILDGNWTTGFSTSN